MAPTVEDWQETLQGIHSMEKMTFAGKLQSETFEKWCSKRNTAARRPELL